MLKHVMRCYPSESCGLLAGRGCEVYHCYPIKNESHDPTKFRMKPIDQLRAFIQIEKDGMELQGIYHSHPMALAEPSLQDIEQNYYPDVISIIWSIADGIWTVHAFQMGKRTFKTVRLL